MFFFFGPLFILFLKIQRDICHIFVVSFSFYQIIVTALMKQLMFMIIYVFITWFKFPESIQIITVHRITHIIMGLSRHEPQMPHMLQ